MNYIKTWCYEDYNFPIKGGAHAFWISQLHLFREEPSLSKYFRYLIYCVEIAESKDIGQKKILTAVLNIFSRFYFILRKITLSFLSKFSIFINSEDIYFDILIVPSYSTISRESEQIIISKLINSSIAQGLKVGIIYDSKYAAILDSILEGKAESIILIKLEKRLGRITRKIFSYAAYFFAKYDLCILTGKLAEKNIRINSVVDISNSVFYEIAWKYFSSKIDCRSVILRCEWDDYSFPIKDWARRLNIPIHCFQHGVISHSLDVPVEVDRFFVFGEHSAGLLKSLNDQFFTLTGQQKREVEFIPIGSITDKIVSIENNFYKKTILIIDQSVGRAVKFNGLESQIEDLNSLIRDLLITNHVKKIILRPHPQADLAYFLEKFSDERIHKLEFSNPSIPLIEDIKRSSISVGLFSGAQVTCAASGLPSYFLVSENGYYTPDLACFDEGFSLQKEEIFEEIKIAFNDENFYISKKNECLNMSKKYYKGKEQCLFDTLFLSENIRFSN